MLLARPWDASIRQVGTRSTHEDVRFGGPPDHPLLARIYRPVGVAGPFPALVDVHGGAWMYFDRTGDMLLRPRARRLRHGGGRARLPPGADTLSHRRGRRRRAASASCKANAAGLDVAPAAARAGRRLERRAPAPPGSAASRCRRVRHDGIRRQTATRVDARVAYALPLWPIADPLARYRYLLDRIAHPRPSRERFFLPERLKEGHDGFFGDEATMAPASVPRRARRGRGAAPAVALDRAPGARRERHPRDDRRAGGGVSPGRRRGRAGSLPGVGHAFANFPARMPTVCIAAMRAFIAGRARRRLLNVPFG